MKQGRWLCLALGLLVSSAAWSEQLPASGALPAGHWAVRAVERLHELGLVTPYLPAQNSVPLSVIRAALAQAAERARTEAPERLVLAQRYLARFDDEFRSTADQAGPLRLQGASLSAGAADLSSRSRPDPEGLTGKGTRALAPLRAPAETFTPTLAGALRGQVSPYLGFALMPRLVESSVALPDWEAVGAWGPLAFSVGKAPVSYGLEGQRSFVLSGAQSLPRVELQTVKPFQLPGFLQHLGHFSVHGFLTRLRDSRHLGRPYLWGASIRSQPHPRLTLSLHRGVMIGDGVREEPLTARKFLKMVFATKNQFENNVMGLAGRWRLPTEAALPLTAYAEWGADDLGAQFKAPAVMVGVRTPSLPTIPAVSLGAEFSFLGAVCCRTFQWYSHHIHRGGWVTANEPLGHPLGGDGREYRLYGATELLDAGVRLEADLFLRQRFLVNLYSPYRSGTSLGISTSAAWRVTERAELGLQLSQEGGNGWRLGDVAARATLFF